MHLFLKENRNEKILHLLASKKYYELATFFNGFTKADRPSFNRVFNCLFRVKLLFRERLSKTSFGNENE